MAPGTLRHDLRRARRGVWAAALALLTLLLSVGLLIQRGQADEREALTARFDARQATAARFIEAFVAEVFERERALAGRSFAGPVSAAGFARTAADQGYAAAVLLDGHGRAIATQPAAPELTGRDLAARYPHLRAAVDGRPAVSGVVPSAARGVPVVGFAVPFESAAGRRVFSGAYSVEDTPLAAFVRNAIPFRTGLVLIVDGPGTVVTSNQSDSEGRPLADTHPALAGIGAATGSIGSAGGHRYVTQSRIAGTPWRLVFAVDTSELFAPLTGLSRWVPWLALAAFGVAAFAALAVVHPYLVQRARLVESEGRRRTILDTAGDAFVGIDETGAIREWNAAATALLGWRPAEALGRPLADLVVPPEQRAAHLAGLTRFLRTGQTGLPAEPVRVQALRRDGGRVDVELTLSRMEWESGWHFHGFLRDIGERLRHEEQLRELALTDGLTGLANRRAAMQRLDQALNRADRHGGSVVVVYIDVDRFKAINDRYGHAAGDAVLVEVAQRLRATFRAEDTLARLGGDEFLVVCEDLRNPVDVRVLVERTEAALSRPYLVGDLCLDVTASVGLGGSDADPTVESLLAAADHQMYRVKAAGRPLTGAAGTAPAGAGP